MDMMKMVAVRATHILWPRDVYVVLLWGCLVRYLVIHSPWYVIDCVDMIAYRVWKRSGFSSASECCGVLLTYWKKN